MQTEIIDYSLDNILFKGFAAYPNNTKSPAVLIAPSWAGCDEFVQNKAKELAQLGYVGFAIDMYGNGKIGNSADENAALMQPLMQDRLLLQRRIQTAFRAAEKLSQVDPQKIAAIGFCFGGLCVLDLARSGIPLAGVVSFHGLLMPPENLSLEPIHAKILALHGYDDPMVPPEQVKAFADEMTRRQADWQIHIYGNTQHAFTNPHAHDSKLGTVYQPLAARRSWQSMKNFLSEIFDA